MSYTCFFLRVLCGGSIQNSAATAASELLHSLYKQITGRYEGGLVSETVNDKSVVLRNNLGPIRPFYYRYVVVDSYRRSRVWKPSKSGVCRRIAHLLGPVSGRRNARG